MEFVININIIDSENSMLRLYLQKKMEKVNAKKFGLPGMRTHEDT